MKTKAHIGLITLCFLIGSCSENDAPSTVGAGNNAPVIRELGDTTAVVGDTLYLQVIASDPDGDDLAYGFTWYSTGGSGITPAAEVDTTTGSFWFAPTGLDLSDHVFTMVAYDPEGAEDSAEFKVDIGIPDTTVVDYALPTLTGEYSLDEQCRRETVTYDGPPGQILELKPVVSGFGGGSWIECCCPNSKFSWHLFVEFRIDKLGDPGTTVWWNDLGELPAPHHDFLLGYWATVPPVGISSGDRLQSRLCMNPEYPNWSWNECRSRLPNPGTNTSEVRLLLKVRYIKW